MTETRNIQQFRAKVKPMNANYIDEADRQEDEHDWQKLDMTFQAEDNKSELEFYVCSKCKAEKTVKVKRSP